MIDRIPVMALPNALLLVFCVVAIYLPQMSAQSVSPTNSNSTTPPDRQFLLSTSMSTNFDIDPLTNDAGLAGPVDRLKNIHIQGRLIPIYNPQDADNIQQGDIALITCDTNAYVGPLGESPQSASFTVGVAADKSPGAIVLYSTNSSRCSLTATNGFTYTSLYTTIDHTEFASIQRALGSNSSPSDSSRIILASTAGNSTNEGTFTKSPTTAVAMIILYSITGIITALFLIIIIIGAIRAHRHPERYGPRHVIGRPRQSRAKGIARAMLETLPIVKFGDKDDKPVTHVELGAAGETTPNPAQGGQESQGQIADESSRDNAVNPEPDLVKTETADGIINPQQGKVEDGMNADNGLACSVCTDDFVKGQDIRVLPCNHKFHPQCIDPWLLNVSGTCPLCRVDLRPTTIHSPEHPDFPDNSFIPAFGSPYLIPSQYPLRRTSTVTSTSSPNATEDPSNPPNPTPTHPPNRRSRTSLSVYLQNTLNRRRMRDATPAERIEALRTLRTANRAQEWESAAPNEHGPRNRMSARFSRVFNSTSRPASGVSSTIVPSMPEREDLPEGER